MRPIRLLLSLTVLGGVSLAVLGTACSKSNKTPAQSFTPSAGEDEDDNEDAKDGLDDDGGAPPLHEDGGTAIPSKIRYVMVLVKENHTFDNYFTDFPGAESSKTAKLPNGMVQL